LERRENGAWFLDSTVFVAVFFCSLFPSYYFTLHCSAYRASLVCGGYRNHFTMEFAGVSMQRGLGANYLY